MPPPLSEDDYKEAAQKGRSANVLFLGTLSSDGFSLERPRLPQP